MADGEFDNVFINDGSTGNAAACGVLKFEEDNQSAYWILAKRGSAYSTPDNLIFSYWDGSNWHQLLDLDPNDDHVDLNLGKLKFSTDVNLYRSAANVLKTDDSLVVDAQLGVAVSPAAKIHAQLSATSYVWSPYSGTVAIFESNTNSHAILSIVGGANYYSSIWFGDPDSQSAGRLRYDHSANAMSFWVSDDPKVTISGGQVQIPTVGPGGGLLLGGDVNIYRSAANVLSTDDNLSVALDFWVGTLAAGNYSGVFLNNGGTITVWRYSAAPYIDFVTDFGDSVDMRLLKTTTHDLNIYTGGSSNLILSAQVTAAGRLALPVTGSSGGLLIGGDTNLYRSAADTLKTDDSMEVAGSYLTASGDLYTGSDYNIKINGTTQKIEFGDRSTTFDVNLYRNDANVLKTDDKFEANRLAATNLVTSKNFSSIQEAVNYLES